MKLRTLSVRCLLCVVNSGPLVGRPVDDKFPVKSSAGSFRGKSSGVVVSSVSPVYSFEDERISPCIWASSRLIHAVVQCGRLPVHVLVAYLHPCAYVGGSRQT